MALTDEEIRNRLEGLVKALEATTRASGGAQAEIDVSVIGPTLEDAKGRLSEGDPLKATVDKLLSGDSDTVPAVNALAVVHLVLAALKPPSPISVLSSSARKRVPPLFFRRPDD